MKPNYYNQQLQFGFGGGGITPAIKQLLIANGVVFFLQMIAGDTFIALFGLHPELVFKRFFIWQFLTYMFLHDGMFHIFFNMLMLWMFGGEVERSWGSKEFLKYYFICGIGAGLVQFILRPALVIGASGAVYGVLIAFILLYPNRKLMFFPFFISLKAKYWAMIFAGISVLMGIWGNDRIAHFAHLGGMVIGFVYIKFGWKLFLSDFFYKKKVEIKHKTISRKRERILKIRKEVDAILDKINDVGYENLSNRDREVLKDASDALTKENDELEN
jgi:membrane associated rhomboid family serine protease